MKFEVSRVKEIFKWTVVRGRLSYTNLFENHVKKYENC